MLSRTLARASTAVATATRRTPAQQLWGCRRALADAAVAKREEKDKVEVKVHTKEEKITRQRELTVTSPLNRGVFIPDDQLPAIVEGEEGILAAARDYKAYKDRIAMIAKPARHAMTSGTYKFRHWRITFDHQEAWTNHLMGWTSSADSLQQLNLRFETKEQAIKFCERQGIKYEVHEQQEKISQAGKKDYGDNFLSQLAKSRIAKHGEKHFEYDETHHQSHWANLECNKFGQTPWEEKETRWIAKFAGGKYQPKARSHEFPSQ